MRHRRRTMRWMYELSSGPELSTSSSYCCSCEPEFDPTLLLIESRHDALSSPSTLCIQVPSPLAWGRNNFSELHAQRRHVLGDGVCGSMLTASPFSYSSTIGVPAVDYGGSSTNCCCINTCWYLVPGRWYVGSPNHTKKMKCLFLHRAAHKILHSFEEVQQRSHKQKGQTGSIFEPQKVLHKTRPTPTPINRC